ncbi:MAG: hypothetical protein MJZ09_09060 [Bacteroidales bacterium]|nr:hypothetical protein [Bacteroidales bacterium]
MRKKIKASKVAFIVVGVATLIVAIYIMANHLGISNDLDFGAGAYYYADIPEFEKLEKNAQYTTNVPVWVHVVLFLGWGFLMYRLWNWIDRK